MGRLRRLGLVTVSLLALVMPLTAAPAGASQWEQIVSKWSTKCVDVRDQEADDLFPHVQQMKCKGSDVSNQQWLKVLQWNGTYQLLSKRNGKCLSVDGDATFSGALIVTDFCSTDDTSQQWLFDFPPSNAGLSRWLRNGRSGKCLELPGWNTNDGLLLAQSDCVGGWKQYWDTRG
ncbi:MAG TPA: RICIN domain-containing protein [Amycolatopsis sp.]|nr:RICIN domain-containing protein [Amycolatopsis sp.]